LPNFFGRVLRPEIFSLRASDRGPELNWDPAIVSGVHQLPEGDAFARLADEASASLPQAARKTLHEWRGKDDSLRLHQAAYIGVRLQKLGVHHLHVHFAGMAARTAFWIKRFFGIRVQPRPFMPTISLCRTILRSGLSQIFSMASAIRRSERFRRESTA
jgi:hypothetical protein